jgi:hypothetical protein
LKSARRGGQHSSLSPADGVACSHLFHLEVSMRRKLAWAAACLLVVVFAFTIRPLSQTQSVVKYNGIINDFSPRSTTPTGPYLVSGPWSVKLNPHGNSEFTASLTMVRSDLWFTDLANSPDPDSQAHRNFHSHHVLMTAGQVTSGGGVIQISGPVLVTSNGNEVFPDTSVQVELSGGSALAPSNVKMTFIGPATAHFTTQPYDGVVAVP